MWNWTCTLPILWASISIGWAATLCRTEQGPQPPNLLPQFKDPVEVGLNVSDNVRAILPYFNANAGSERDYDLIDGLDGLTIGVGNWPQSQLEKFFQSLAVDRNGATLRDLVTTLVFYFQRHAGDWATLQKTAKVTGAADNTAIGEALRRTVLNQEFMRRYEKNCTRTTPGHPCIGPPVFVTEQPWFVKSMCMGLRTRSVAEWEARFWEEDILRPSIDFAEKTDLQTPAAAKILIASLYSSYPNPTKSVVELLARCPNGGPRPNCMLNMGPLSWDLTKHRFISSPTAEQLNSWRLMAVWQWYTTRQGRIRSRMQKFFDEFLAKDWVLPAPDSDRDPRNWAPNHLQMR
jgi:hypothetical protein